MGEQDVMDRQALGLVPFKTGDDPRRGRGPAPGAPNAGRPPDAVRAACRVAFDERVPMLAELADNGTPEIRLRALDMLGRYGLGTSFTLEATSAPSGVVVLPELEMRRVQARMQESRELLTESSDAEYFGEPEFEYVIEDVTAFADGEDRIAQEIASRDEERVDPELARKVLAARQLRLAPI